LSLTADLLHRSQQRERKEGRVKGVEEGRGEEVTNEGEEEEGGE